MTTRITVEEAIAACKFVSEYIGLPLEKFPLTEEPVESAGEISLGEYRKTGSVIEKVDRANKKFASPLTALRYVAKYQGTCFSHHPLTVLFEVDGQLWTMLVIRMGSGRELNISQDDVEDEWREGDRFLVVDK